MTQSQRSGAGVPVAAWLLSQRSPRHLTEELLKAVQDLAEAVRLSPDLRAHVIAHLLLNLRLWSASPLSAQRALLQQTTHLLKVSAHTRSFSRDAVPAGRGVGGGKGKGG